MSNVALVQRMVDRILIQDLEPALDLIAEQVELMVLPPELGAAAPEIHRGRYAVRDYFESLGGIVTFWQVRLVSDGDQVLVWGKESYTTNGGMESESEFVLVCQVGAGVIERILVVEDLAGAALLPTKLVARHPSGGEQRGWNRRSPWEGRMSRRELQPCITATWEG
jgi:ketosteroid isomerase-like protein